MNCVNPVCENQVGRYLLPFGWTICEECIQEYYLEGEP